MSIRNLPAKLKQKLRSESNLTVNVIVLVDDPFQWHTGIALASSLSRAMHMMAVILYSHLFSIRTSNKWIFFFWNKKKRGWRTPPHWPLIQASTATLALPRQSARRRRPPQWQCCSASIRWYAYLILLSQKTKNQCLSLRWFEWTRLVRFLFQI